MNGAFKHVKYFLAACLLMTRYAWAVEDIQSDSKSGTDLVPAATVTVAGNRYSSSSSNSDLSSRSYWTASAYGLVKLQCPGAYTASPAITGTATLNVTISYKREVNGIFVDESRNEVLELVFNAETAQDIAYVKLDNAQWVEVEIQNTGNSIPSGWPDLELSVEVHTESFEWMTPSAIGSTTLSHESTLTTDGNLKVEWTSIAAASAYELEWTYVSDQSSDPAVRLSASEVEVNRFLFRDNSSRVEVTGLSYEIPMVYERGFIIYRLRAIGKNLINGVPVLVKSDWTVADGTTSLVSEFPSANVFTYDGLEQNLNWQSSLSFAEEGKHKVVLSYHDGSARNRQAVTRINSDQRSIVGETLYDYNGRPVIQLLPVPVTQNTLAYFPHFNLVEGTTLMDKEDYDQAVAGDPCTIAAPPFDTLSGASNYYSKANAFSGAGGNTGANLLNRDLIPRAEKYPYTQTRYTPDNTGRIAAQSGVGIQYTLGSQHETRYLYAVPQQAELSRLFGAQVGYAGHYKKNTVIDLNGQTSVSYLDLDGKVIATALAGDKPAELDALDWNPQRSIQAELLKQDAFSNRISVDRLSKIYSSKFTVTSATAYDFSYDGNIGFYHLSCSLPGSENPIDLDLDGAVDVEWSLVNGCGEEIFTGTDQTDQGNTGASQVLNLSQSNVNLAPGEYQITKTLKINEDKLDNYWLDYLEEEGTCILSQQDFIDQEMAGVNLLGCGLTCERCQEAVDSIIEATPLLTQDQINSLNSICDDLCDPSIGCRASLESMRGDMSPGGQYAELRKSKTTTTSTGDEMAFDENGNPVVPDIDIQINSTDGSIFNDGDPDESKIVAEQFPMSIFNEGNQLRVHRILESLLPDLRASWRKPLRIQSSSYSGTNWGNQILDSKIDLTYNVTYALTDYRDRQGEIVYAEVYKILNEETMTYYYKPEITTPDSLEAVNADLGLYRIKVKFLSRLEDFERYWQTHWANYLIPYHPEFEYLLDCTGDQDEMDFDYKLINSGTLAQAVENELLSSGGVPLIVGATQETSKDPFIRDNTANYDFIKDKNDDYKTATVNGVSASRSMVEMANIAVGCPRGITVCSTSCVKSTIDTDQEWNVYKAYYLAEKQKIIRQQKLRKAVDNAYYNGCIGHPNVFTIPDAEYFRRQVTYQYPVQRWRWQCDGWWIWRNCSLVQYTAFQQATTYPYLNPDQLCYIRDTYRYADKQQRFYQNMPASVGGTQISYRCAEYLDNPGGDPIMIPVACDEDITEAMNNTVTDAQRYKYQECGQCPMAADLEQLIKDLKAEDLLVSSSEILMTCETDNIKTEIGEVLYNALEGLNSNDPYIYWSSALSNSNKTLTGTLISDGSPIATLTLDIPAGPLDFTNIGTLCCLSIDDSYSGGDFGKYFHLKTSYYDAAENDDEEVIIDGHFTIAVSPCYIPPRCQVTTDTRRVVFFLDALCNSGGTLTDKNHDLNSGGSDVELLDADISDFYTLPLRSILKVDIGNAEGGYVEDLSAFAPVWNSTVSSPDNVLSGTLTYTDESEVEHELLIEISELPNTYTYGQIIEFVKIRPEPIAPSTICDTQPCEKTTFLADVLMEISGTRVYETVKINVPSLKPVICTPVVPASN